MKSYIEDIMYDRRSDVISLPLRFVLRILSILYNIAVTLRNSLYDKRRIFKVMDVPCRVVSVGNLTIGGTGKTPVVIMTVNQLKSAGYTVAVVSRGYKRKGREPLVVSDGDSIVSTPVEAGDEPYIIASETGVPVVVGTDRYEAAELAFRRFKPEVIVLDDGFQHRHLYRNVDIITIDAGNPYGNELLLPRGVLRESPRGLSRAKAVVITRYDDSLRRDSIERRVRYYDRNVPIFWSNHVPKALRLPLSDTDRDIETIRGKKIAALSNIAQPSSFHQTLVSLGAEIVKVISMTDHHRYNERELEQIERDIINAGTDMVVMTAKDERNLPDSYRFKTIKAFVLDIKALLLEDNEKYFKIIEPVKKNMGKNMEN
ncbi:MAG: tetraacyldisaccharide 4'-kinase [Candidatus Latescibacteria bacterium]|nr:tetraacyldisaccharide 4'-kinase [Candidatus Latescibacterota bacterium]